MDQFDIAEKITPELKVAHYCVAFLDLLGQRNALGGHQLLPPSTSPIERDKFIEIVRNSIGAIALMQKIAQDILDSLKPNDQSSLKLSLPIQAHAHWDAMQKDNVKLQRWSDGLIVFSCLGDEEIKCNMVSIFHLFVVAGGLMFLTLAAGRPVRGAIEVSWGTELHPDELYGNAIAEPYHLESSIADFPRIVIGKEIVRLLSAVSMNRSSDIYAQLNTRLADKCLKMLAIDKDGVHFLDYLGNGFQEASPLPEDLRTDAYVATISFANAQLQMHRASGCEKLVRKYDALLEYLTSKLGC